MGLIWTKKNPSTKLKKNCQIKWLNVVFIKLKGFHVKISQLDEVVSTSGAISFVDTSSSAQTYLNPIWEQNKKY